MVFSTPIFLFAFLPVLLVLYYAPWRAGRMYRNVLLLAASIFFYAWGEPVLVSLMLMSIMVNWGIGLLIHRPQGLIRGKLAVALAVAYNMGLLFVFKYLVFTLANLGWLLHKPLPVLHITLPIGISFYSFQALSYVIDVYRGTGTAQRDPLDVGLYISLFPQLIAGPIVRYETVAGQIRGRQESLDDFSRGVSRFVVGLAKKLVLANQMAVVANMAFAMPDGMSIGTAWLGACAYGFQIYFDFSGYSDMAIGLGRMFGFHFLENFNHPYFARSITDFWRRWHISLSTWFRDYIYFPMGGSRVSTRSRLVFNLFVVWMLTGVWHGANWTFVLWGALYFSLLTIEKLTRFDQKIGRLGHLYAMLFVLVGWVLFRAPTVTAAGHYLRIMFGFARAPLVDGKCVFYWMDYRIYFIAALICSMPLADLTPAKYLRQGRLGGLLHVSWIAGLLLLSISFMIKSDFNPFIYFNF